MKKAQEREKKVAEWHNNSKTILNIILLVKEGLIQ